MSTIESNQALDFLRGGGEVGVMMRAYDWRSSPLGHPGTWPQSLRSIVSLILNSKFPMFLAWGKDLGFLYNDAYAEILGEKHPSALGNRFQDIWPELWDDIHPLIMRALAGEASYHDNLPLRMRRHGYEEQAFFTFSYSPVLDETGAVAGMYCACTETTAQVLAEQERLEENERLRSLFEQAPGFMALVRGPQHVFTLTNKAYLQLVGHRELLGKPVCVALPEVESQGFIQLLDTVYKTGEPFIGNSWSVKLQRLPGGALEERYVDFIFQPIKDASGRVTGIFAQGSDVTERKRALDELHASSRRKDEFLAMLAHELRNPLAPISSAAQLLDLGGLDESRIRNASSVIRRQVEHMTDLVNDLLDVSRVTRGLIVLDQEPVEMNAVVSCALEQVRSSIDAKRHRLTLHTSAGPAYVRGDQTRLVQVLANMLSNAAKYTPSGGEIDLRVDVTDGEVEICVADNGVGISEDILPYVFDLFIQAERTPDRSQGGLGLGLALVKSLVHLHGGRVSAKSAGPGRGSEFSVTLPLLKTLPHSQPGSANNLDKTGTAGGLRVLVVDDNADAANTVAMLLEAQGHAVAVAYDAKSALERIQREVPELLLIDIGLPDMDGYELARRLRAIPETRESVLVALTGYGQTSDREQSAAAGFNHHLVKPASISEVTAILAETAKNRRP